MKELLSRLDRLIALLELGIPRPHKFQVGDQVVLRVERAGGAPIKEGAFLKVISRNGWSDGDCYYTVAPLHQDAYLDELYLNGDFFYQDWVIAEKFLVQPDFRIKDA